MRLWGELGNERLNLHRMDYSYRPRAILGIIIQLAPLVRLLLHHGVWFLTMSLQIHCYPITELCIPHISHCIMHTTSAQVKLTIADHAMEMNQVDVDYPCYVLDMESTKKF
jgi:hypothetical protein